METAQIPAGSLPKPWVIGSLEEAEAPSSPHPPTQAAAVEEGIFSIIGQELPMSLETIRGMKKLVDSICQSYQKTHAEEQTFSRGWLISSSGSWVLS